MPATSRLRRVRHIGFVRSNRQRKLNRFLVARQAALAGTGSSATFTGAAGTSVTWMAHGKVAGAGPFALTTTGTLPNGLLPNALYWVLSVLGANTITLSSKKGGPVATMTDAGSGTHTITKASDLNAMFEYNKQSGPAALLACADVDTL